MRFLSILFPFLLCIASLRSSFGEETATEIVAARELIRGRLAANDARLDEVARSLIRELRASDAHEDKVLLAKCLRFAEHPVAMSSEMEGYYYPVRRLCLSSTHAGYFVREFAMHTSIYYKMLIAGEVWNARKSKDEFENIYADILSCSPSNVSGFGPEEELNELLYVVNRLGDLGKSSFGGKRFDWKAVDAQAEPDQPMDPISRKLLHEAFPEWKWLKANVPNPPEEEVMDYLKAIDPDSYAWHIFQQKKSAPVLAETTVAEHSFWQAGSLWWAFGCAVLIGLGAWFWRARRA